MATSRYKTFKTVEEAEVARAKGVANGYEKAKIPRGKSVDRLWLYTRPDSNKDGSTIVVCAHTSKGLLYLREDGSWQ